LTSELVLRIGKNSRRAADLAICEKSKITATKEKHKYLDFPPKYVIENKWKDRNKLN